jgi:hypothetical protein
MPHPPQVPDRLAATGATLREVLEDADRELGAIMAKKAGETGYENPSLDPPMPSANLDVERTLGATGCKSFCYYPSVCVTQLTRMLQTNGKRWVVARSRQTLTFRTLLHHQPQFIVSLELLTCRLQVLQ